MASRVARQPNKVSKIGMRIMAYLKATQDIKLVVGRQLRSNNNNPSPPMHNTQHAQHAVSDAVILSAYSDASFAPTGSKSYGAILVAINETPVS